MKCISMKFLWIKLGVLLLGKVVFSQDLDTLESKIITNQYGQIVYGNKTFPIIAFYQKDSLKYIYSQSKGKVAILRKNNTILKEIVFKNNDFSFSRFQVFQDKKVILQSWGMDKDYILLENENIIIQKRSIPKNKKIVSFKEIKTAKGTFEVHQYLVSPKNKLSKVLLYKTSQKIDTIYKDTKTKENRIINTSPRAELVYYSDKVYFFNADQRLILIFNEKGILVQEINLNEKEDEFLKSYLLNFYIADNKMYVSSVFGEKTYLWELEETGEFKRYEIPFRVYSIHQIVEDKIYFSLQMENNSLYVYERKFR